MAEARRISVTVKRFLPGKDESPYEQTYQVELHAPSSVLNVLDLIAENQDPTLAYQASCRRGYCAICTVRVNGKVVKSCLEPANCDLVLQPAGRPDKVLKDLAIKW